MKKQNEKGFAAIEATLFVVILALVGFIGWYVWHSKQSTDKTLDTAQNETSAVRVTKKPTSASKPTSQSPILFKIPELGIEFNLPSSLNDLTYAGSTSTGVDVSTKTLSLLDSNCAATSEHGGLGGISKQSGTDSAPSAPDILIKQFSGYYIVYDPPQISCSSNQAALDQISSDTSAFQSALKSVQPIQ